jgi:hypothetical protein
MACALNGTNQRVQIMNVIRGEVIEMYAIERCHGDGPWKRCPIIFYTELGALACVDNMNKVNNEGKLFYRVVCVSMVQP